jgi:hypothetical protein
MLQSQEAFEAECFKIVTEIQEKFIDLNMDDDEGFDQDEMQPKLQKFQQRVA